MLSENSWNLITCPGKANLILDSVLSNKCLERILLVPSFLGRQQLNSETSRLCRRSFAFPKKMSLPFLERFVGSNVNTRLSKIPRTENPCNVCKVYLPTKQKVWKAFQGRILLVSSVFSRQQLNSETSRLRKRSFPFPKEWAYRFRKVS